MSNEYSQNQAKDKNGKSFAEIQLSNVSSALSNSLGGSSGHGLNISPQINDVPIKKNDSNLISNDVKPVVEPVAAPESSIIDTKQLLIIQE